MQRKVTMDEIAQKAGVSKYAISKALSGQSGVSEQTRERIVHLAHEMGYFSQQRHKSNKIEVQAQVGCQVASFSKRSIMVLMPNIRMQSMDSYYWGRIIDGIVHELKAHDLSMIIATEHLEDNLLSLINVKELLGLIVVGTISSSMLRLLSKMELPVIMVDHEDPVLPVDTLFVNNFEGASQLTQYLIDLGHQKLQFVGDITFARSFRERFLGFRNTLEENRLPSMQESSLLYVDSLDLKNTIQQVKDCLTDIRSSETFPTALVCANDDIAIAVMQAVLSLHLSVPEDISITGFDNIDRAKDAPIPLTTMNVGKELLGMRAVEMLLRRSGNLTKCREKVLLATDIVHRESTACAKPLIVLT